MRQNAAVSIVASSVRAALPFTNADIERGLATRFEAVVDHQPESLALTGNGRQWSYAELNAEANRLAHAVRARTDHSAGCVAYLLDVSPEMVIATLGAWKAGQAYLALHPGMPQRAQAEAMTNVAPALLITNHTFEARARAIAGDACEVIALESLTGSVPADNPTQTTGPSDAATVFFTSGTTGQAKAVVRSHRAVLHRVWLSTQYEIIQPSDRQSLLTHCSFAVSQADLCGALLLGAAVCVFDVAHSGLPAFREWLIGEGITVLRPPVQLFRRFLATLDAGEVFPRVRLVALGGDVVLPADLEGWKRHFPSPGVLHHRLNTTETTLLTFGEVRHDTVIDRETITAGWPVPDKALSVIGDDGQALSVGEVGELVVTSAYLADGYWRQPEATARAFAPDPLDARRRVYLTGDLARALPDGRFEFIGRRDHQVKIRGYRVDIREVEAALLEVDGVSEVAVVPVTERGEQQLLAFIVPSSGLLVEPSAIRQQAKRLLPEWKVPARFYGLASLPSTLSGKLDRQGLLAHARHEDGQAAERQARAGAPPADEVEAMVAGLFEAQLRLGPVGRAGDFFQLGGDSLTATVLHAELERVTGVRIPLEALLVDATVAGMAMTVRAARASASTTGPRRPPVLIPLRRGGTEPVFFFVHGRSGQAFLSPSSMEVLGPEQPVYAFQATGLDWAQLPQRTIACMASEYVRALKHVQPAGPYFLGAACAGACVVTEMANQIRRAGEGVGPLLLFDPPVRWVGDRPWLTRQFLRARVALRKHNPWRRYAKTIRALRDKAKSGRAQLDANDPAALNAAADAAFNFEMARLRHTDWHYDGPVLMLRSARRLARDGPGRRVFSRHLRGDVQWFDVGATHRDVRRSENAIFAGRLRDAVTIARQGLAALRSTTTAAE